MEKICPAKVALHQALSGGEADIFSETRMTPVLPVERVDIYCDPERCDGPLLTERHRLSLARLFGSTQYEICPVDEIPVEISA